MAELKQNTVLNFDGGLLTIKLAGHGDGNGWATFAFDDSQVDIDEDGFHVVEIAPTELREFRDFIDRAIAQRAALQEAGR